MPHWHVACSTVCTPCNTLLKATMSCNVRVDGNVWDLTRPLTDDCKLEFCSFDEPDGREVRMLSMQPGDPFSRHQPQAQQPAHVTCWHTSIGLPLHRASARLCAALSEAASR